MEKKLTVELLTKPNFFDNKRDNDFTKKEDCYPEDNCQPCPPWVCGPDMPCQPNSGTECYPEYDATDKSATEDSPRDSEANTVTI